MTKLERMSSGVFHINQSLIIDELQKKLSKNFPQEEEQLKYFLGDSFFSPSEALSQFPESGVDW